MSAYTEEYVQGLLAENERLRLLVDGLKAESEAQVANLASLYVAVTSMHGALDRPERPLVGAGDRHQSDWLGGNGDLRDRSRTGPADAARLDRY